MTGKNNESKKVVVESTKPARKDDTDKLITPAAATGKDKEDNSLPTHLGHIQLTEVTGQIFEPLRKGQIARYGNTGWIMRCLDCNDLIILEDDTHKAYISRDSKTYRLVPSLVCPHSGCKFHAFANIRPEKVENNDDAGTEAQQQSAASVEG